MVKVSFGGVEVDRCTDCEGLFFDEFEKEQLRKMKGADAIDIGDAKTGRDLAELRGEIREQDAIFAEVDGVVIAVAAEVEDQRDLVGVVLLRLDARAIDSGEELRA